MMGVVDQGHVGALVLLDLSAASDTVDHSILMDVLRRRFGIDGSALSWVTKFLSNRGDRWYIVYTLARLSLITLRYSFYFSELMTFEI